LLGCHVGQHWLFAILSFLIALFFRPELVFSRNYIFPWVTSKWGIKTVAESHAHPDNRTASFMRLVGATGKGAFQAWVTISHTLANHYHSLGVPREKLIVLPDAVDLQLFQRPRELPPSPYSNSQPNVVYAGHLYDYKGIPTVLAAAAQLPEVHFHLVGGWSEDISRQKRRARELALENVTFHGLIMHSAVPTYLWHADVLLLPPSLNHPSADWTSPVKLGEYLASGVPVVATDISGLRNWLTEREAEFVQPDNVESLAEGIQRLLSDKQRARHLRQAGFEKAQELSYERRAGAILQRLESIT
jgi:glycosyltransferase involved in cell wall biosynthesis